MTTKLKKKIVELSRKEKITKDFLVFYGITFMIAVFSCFFDELMAIAAVLLVVILVLGCFIEEALLAIKKQTDEVINNNKLIYIVLSDKKAVRNYLELILIFPVFWIAAALIEFNLITIVLYITISMAVIIKLPKVISNYFERVVRK